MAITTTQAINIIDNISKSIVDLETSFVTNPAAVAPTVATITGGQIGAANTLQARVAALSAADLTGYIGSNWYEVANAVTTYTETTNAKNAIYKLFVPMLYALDADLGGLREFLLLNSLQVHSEFAAALNYLSANAPQFGYPVTPSPLTPSVIFPAAEVILGSIAVTGAAAGTFTAGTDGSVLYAGQQLKIKNTGASTSTGTTTSFTITYTNASYVAGQTVTQALAATLAAGASINAGSATGMAVSNIVINSGGGTGDHFAVVIEPLRTVAY